MGNLSKIVLDDETLEVEDTKARTEIGDIATLKTNAKDTLVKAVNECFQSASDGKAVIASAITGKGIATNADATFQTMASNIAKIETGIKTTDATATAGQILAGATAYGANGKITGTMKNNGAIKKSLGAGESYTIPAGYHSGSGAVTVSNQNNAKLNLFTQTSEPATKDGIWVKTSNTFKKVIIDNHVLNAGGVWGNVINDLPFEVYGSGIVVYGGEIHVLGSYNTTYQKAHYKFNGSSWVSVSTLPYEFYDGRAIVLNNEIHILGGASTKNHYKFNGTTWVSVSNLPFSLNGGGAVLLNNEIHIVIGTSHYKFNGSSWVSVSTLPYSYSKNCIVTYNGELHMLGSSTNNNNYIHYKFNGSTWVSVSTLPYYFYVGCAVVFNGQIHILGSGATESGRKHYKFNGSTWESVSTLPYHLMNTTAVVLNNAIHIIGSSDSSAYRSRAAFTTPENLYEPYTLIIQRGNVHNGVYLTAIANTSAITGSNNRFVSGFDDVWFFGASAFEMTAPMYYGDGTRWIKFKN